MSKEIAPNFCKRNQCPIDHLAWMASVTVHLLYWCSLQYVGYRNCIDCEYLKIHMFEVWKK